MPYRMCKNVMKCMFFYLLATKCQNRCYLYHYAELSTHFQFLLQGQMKFRNNKDGTRQRTNRVTGYRRQLGCVWVLSWELYLNYHSFLRFRSFSLLVIFRDHFFLRFRSFSLLVLFRDHLFLRFRFFSLLVIFRVRRERWQDRGRLFFGTVFMTILMSY